MSSSNDTCFFNCSNPSNKLLSASRIRIETIIKSSIRRGDGIHKKLTNSQVIMCHKNCVSTYTSEHHIKRHEQLTNNDPPLAKKPRRCETGEFIFKKHCIFCGKNCEPLDPRNPSRWRKVVQCKTVDRGKDQLPFKQSILLICDRRNDLQADEVRLRIQGAVSDLHAADAQYHFDCYNVFVSPRVIQAASKTSSIPADVDTAFSQVVEKMEQDKSQLWNSVDLHDLYVHLGGDRLSRRCLVEDVINHFGMELIKLSGNGYASLLVFRGHAPNILRAVDDTDEETPDLKHIVKCIIQETKKLKSNSNSYNTRISKNIAEDVVSPTLRNLLTAISPKLTGSNQALLIGNIITSCVNHQPTSLQIALGVLLREKHLIDECYAFGICASYDEVLRFKTSAAHASCNDKEMRGMYNSNKGFIQIVADNYDANVCSPNGLHSTHALAVLLTQTTGNGITEVIDSPSKVPVIRRISKAEMSNELVPPIPVHRYNGPKKPDMPENCCKHHILPLRVLASRIVSLSRAHDLDHLFLQGVIENPGCTPEYNGYNVRISRNQGHSVKSATRAVYTPLIDMTPSDPDTIMSAMIEAQRLTNECGQAITVFTNDQQLYRVAVNITWVYPELFKNFMPRLGGMHTLMGFIGSVGTLMNNTGLTEVMQSAFGGVPKMLSGKKFPQNMRAMRMVTEEILRPLIQTSTDYEHLMSILNNKASQSKTAKMWVDNFIKPVLLMMVFVRSEREADWPLHLWAVGEMLPYFFAAGHCNYAR